MTDIKSLGHQSIHSTQSAQSESTQKSSEIVKEERPAEFRPLSNEQKENIKQSRIAEGKFAEAAIKKEFFDEWPSKPADYHVDKHETEAYYKDHPSEHHLSQHATRAYYAERPAEDHLSKHTNEMYGKNPERFTKAGAAAPKDIVKSGSELLPIGTGPGGDFPGQDDLKKVAKVIDKAITGADMPQGKLDGEESGVPMFKEEKVKQAEKFFPSIRFEPATPILDGEDEREEEGLGLNVVATEPPSIKSGNE